MKKLIAIVVLIFLLILFYNYTGFLQKSRIDEKDLKNWEYLNGIIKDADGYELNGSQECWIMVHGYTSTPDELRIVATALNKKFNDTVYVPRLYGHGMVPSNLEKYSVDDWYNQIANLMEKNKCDYILGSSMGANIALKYIEENDIKGAVIVGLTTDFEPSYLPMEYLTKLLYPVSRYLKKKSPGETIINMEGKKEHISTYAFPLKAVVELIDFNKIILKDLKKIETPVIFLHATQDKAANIESARDVYKSIINENEFFEMNGGHIIFRDYGKLDAVERVINFRSKY